MKEDFNIEKINSELKRIYGISNRSIINTVLKEAGVYELLEASIKVCQDAQIMSLGEEGETVKVMIDNVNELIKVVEKATK